MPPPFGALLALLVAAPFTTEPRTGPPVADGTARLAASSNAFGLDLYAHLQSRPGNLALSPASISVALAMTWLGARGDTAASMQDVMRAGGSPGDVAEGWGELSAALQDSEGALTLRVASRLFGEKSYAFEDAFQDATRAAFGAPLEAVDFKTAPEPSRAHMNDWVEGQTEGRIHHLIPRGGILADTRLVLVNALYFLAEWRDPFAGDETSEAPFFMSKSTRKDVPTMHRTATLRIAHTHGVEVLEIPYKGDRMSMLLALPDEMEGLGTLEASLGLARLDAWVKALAPERVAVSLPKFEIADGALSLGDLLKAMGMGVAFDRQKADFTGIANPVDPANRLFVDAVFHQAFVKVDEQGTEAAAATAVEAVRFGQAMPVKAMEFKADHPFLFFLRDDVSGLVLFMGRVAEP